MKNTDKLSNSILYRGVQKVLKSHYDAELADQIWRTANKYYLEYKKQYSKLSLENKMMILPVAALYRSMIQYGCDDALDLLKKYGTSIGDQIASVIYKITSFPMVSIMIWKLMPSLMRSMSSPSKGYQRRIISENSTLIAVDITSCPLHDAAVLIQVPEAAQVACAIDKAYMKGFKYIRYTRSTSVADKDECCDYRLSYDKEKKGKV